MRSHLAAPVALVSTLFLFACGDDGGSESSSGGEATPSEAQRIWDEQPQPPTHTAHRYAFTPPDSCGQGPYAIGFDAEGSAFMEGFDAYACVKHRIRGDARVTVEGREPDPPYVYGYSDPENARCVASDAERSEAAQAETSSAATTASSGASTSRSRGGRRARGESPDSATTAAAAASPATPELPRTDATFDECPEGTFKVEITSMDFTSTEGPAIEAGTHIGLELWSRVPNDLEGAVFVLEHKVSDAGSTAATFEAYRDAYEAWRVRYHAALDAEVARGEEPTEAYAETDAPPPPPRPETPPPRPSVNATWVAGYWVRIEPGADSVRADVDASGKWAFLPGFWRVPESDIEQELTVQAPEPPPPPRVETEDAKGPPPAAQAVWTPGSWQWNGSAYVWVEGAYRIPPAAGQRWRPATWRASVRGRGAVFVPGGWTVGAEGRMPRR